MVLYVHHTNGAFLAGAYFLALIVEESQVIDGGGLA